MYYFWFISILNVVFHPTHTSQYSSDLPFHNTGRRKDTADRRRNSVQTRADVTGHTHNSVIKLMLNLRKAS